MPTRIYALGLPGYFGFETLRRFLFSQRIAHPMMIVLCVSAFVVLPPLTYLLSYHTALGFNGVALSVALCYNLNFCALLAYIWWRRPHHVDSWKGFSSAAFSGLGQYVKVALPGCVMLMLEWMAVEAIGFLAGKFDVG